MNLYREKYISWDKDNCLILSTENAIKIGNNYKENVSKVDYVPPVWMSVIDKRVCPTLRTWVL